MLGCAGQYRVGRTEGTVFYFLYLAIAVAFIAAFGLPAVAALQLSRLSSHEKRLARITLLLLLVVTLSTIVFMEVKLRAFAKELGEPIHGLIGHPDPTISANHIYTERGKEIEIESFRQPFYVDAIVLVLVAAVANFVSKRSRTRFGALPWTAAAIGIGTLFLFWIVREFTAWDIFI